MMRDWEGFKQTAFSYQSHSHGRVLLDSAKSLKDNRELSLSVMLHYVPAVPAQVNITATCKCQSCLMTPDLSDLVHCVFSATAQNVPQRIVGACTLTLRLKDMCACGRVQICNERQKCPNVTPSAQPSHSKGNLIDWLVFSCFPLHSHSPCGWPNDGLFEPGPNQGPPLMRMRLMAK